MPLGTQITNAMVDADVEMTTFLADLNSEDRGKYAGNNMTTVIDRVKAVKSDRFQYITEDLVGADNNITSTAYYIQNASDMTQMADDISSVTTRQLSASEINSGLISRQEEINEWANNNKLDTLFFLQILFITLTFISTMVFLNSNGLISSYLLNLLIVLASFFAVFVLITRARKTSVLRDGRYWNKMRFGTQKAPPMKPKTTCPGDTPPADLTPVTVAPTCNPNLSLLGAIAGVDPAWGGQAASTSTSTPPL
jgi:uncharacterized protein (UPF0333 family)